MTSLETLFAPASVAVVGASTQAGSISRRMLTFLLRYSFPGSVVAVNPNANEIGGVPSYPSLSDVPHPVELALVFTAAQRVVDVVTEAGSLGAKAAIVFSSGFAEMGAAGLAEQERLRTVAAQSGVRVLGPNCQGVIHLPRRMVATFTNAVAAKLPPVGRLAYVGQSGAIGGVLFDMLRQRDVVPAVWVSTGNQVDIDITEVTEHLCDDPDVDTILAYLEQTPDGQRWTQVCERVARADKQLVVLRSGVTPAGREAAFSHTGSLIGDQRSFELVCREHGVLLVDDLRPMIDTVVARGSGTHRAGRRIGVITTSGGAGGMAADLCDRNDLSMARLSDSTVTQVAALLPAFASSTNPVDVTAQYVATDAARFGELCSLVASDPEVDQLVVILSSLVGENAKEVAGSVAAAVPTLATPLNLVYLMGRDRTAEERATMSAAGVGVFDGVGDALDAIGAVARREHTEGTPAGHAPRDTSDDEDMGARTDAGTAGVRSLTEADGLAVLDRGGVARPAAVLARTRAEAQAAADRICGGTGKLVLKVQAPALMHKTEHGAVRVGLEPAEVGAAFDEVMARTSMFAVQGVLVQEMVAAGVELLVGVQGPRDGYAPVLTVGIGGTAVELYGDVASALAPVDDRRALALLQSLRGWPLLAGYRGRPAVAIDAAASAIAALSRLACELGGDLLELEVNPVIVNTDGAYAADFVCRLKARA